MFTWQHTHTHMHTPEQNACFGAYCYSAGSRHLNVHQLPWMTYSIIGPHKNWIKSGEDLAELTRKVEISIVGFLAEY